MILKRFRVQNFKNFDDSSWIEVSNPTVIVGKNESGKTALFRGLSKLNPSDGSKYNRLKDFPRNRLTSEYDSQDWPGASAVFYLEDDEKEQLKEMCPKLSHVKEITVTRYYTDELDICFGKRFDYYSNKEISTVLKNWIKTISESIAPSDKGQVLQNIKNSLTPFLEAKIKEFLNEGEDNIVDENRLKTVIQTFNNSVNEEWQREIFKEIVSKKNEYFEYVETMDSLMEAEEYIKEIMPVFVYFDEFGIIDTAVHIPRFIQELSSSPNDLRVRSKKCLFEHVGLDINTLNKLDPTDTKKTIEELRLIADERHILMNAASQEMTKKFQTWWEQRKHQFRYQVDGPNFRIWVSDNINPSEIELDQRSKGLQYFFSFYLVFIEEAEKLYKNSILLLDEPGLHIHASAQQKIVAFLESLAEKNQLMYSTHSPFMINGDRLDNVRIIYEDKKSGRSKISQDTWPIDQEALFPLQAGLGYSIAQTLFYAKKQVVVEGLSDYDILKSMSLTLSEEGKTALRNDIVIVPAGGATKILPLASMLVGHDVKIAVLLDGDDVGKKKGKEITKQLNVNSLLVTEYIGRDEGEIEDLFEESTYLDAVKIAYPDIEFGFTEEEKIEECISKRVTITFDRLGCDFEKWKPAKVLTELIRTQSNKISSNTKNKFESLFKDINKILK